MKKARVTVFLCIMPAMSPGTGSWALISSRGTHPFPPIYERLQTHGFTPFSFLVSRFSLTRGTLAPLALLGLAALPQAAHAQINLDPGVALQFFSGNTNNGYSTGRGTVFTANSNLTVTGAGLWTNPVGSFLMTWNLYQTTTYPGAVNNVLLATTTVTPADTGLGFYDATFGSPVALTAGNRYHIEVTYAGAAEGNFFYNFDLGSVNLGSVTVEDGTRTGSTTNTVMPLIRLNSGSSSAPEPGTLALLALGIVGGVVAKRRK